MAYGFVPEVIGAPAAVVAPADPYLEGGEGVPFGSFRIRYKVTLVADVGDNQRVTASLDALIEDAAVVLANAGWDVESVAEPYVYQANSNMHLATDLVVSNLITL